MTRLRALLATALYIAITYPADAWRELRAALEEK